VPCIETPFHFLGLSTILVATSVQREKGALTLLDLLFGRYLEMIKIMKCTMHFGLF